MRIEIRELRQDDDRRGFSSGNIELDRFFRNYAGQNQFRLHIGTTYVALAQQAVAGYVTLSAGAIAIEQLPQRQRQRLPAYPLPILRLSRLAVALPHQGCGIGSRLVRFTLESAVEMSKRFGCIGVVVDAKAAAVGYYVRLGFAELPVVSGELPSRPQPQTLFLPIGSIPHVPGVG